MIIVVSTGTKVRRIEPLPEYDEMTPTRTIVAVNLPLGSSPTVESAAELFSRYGEIVLLRIIRPDRPIPPDVKRFVSKHRELGHTTCAVVEYAKLEGARRACEEMTDKDNWRSGGIRVVPLQTPKGNAATVTATEKRGTDAHNECTQNKGGEKKKQNKKKGGLNGSLAADKSDEDLSDVRMDELSVEDGGGVGNHSGTFGTGEGRGKKKKCGAAGGSDGDVVMRDCQSGASKDINKSIIRSSLSPHQDMSRLSPGTSPRVSPRSSPKSSPRGSPNLRRRSCHGQSPLTVGDGGAVTGGRVSPAGGSPSQSPWVQRRLKAQLEDSPLSANNSPGASPRLGRKEGMGGGSEGAGGWRNVIRQPRGPDGTNGFQNLSSVGGGVNNSRFVDKQAL